MEVFRRVWVTKIETVIGPETSCRKVVSELFGSITASILGPNDRTIQPKFDKESRQISLPYRQKNVSAFFAALLKRGGWGIPSCIAGFVIFISYGQSFGSLPMRSDFVMISTRMMRRIRAIRTLSARSWML